MVVEIASWVLILLGSFFTVVGVFGLVRMPEVFTRMHAASVIGYARRRLPDPRHGAAGGLQPRDAEALFLLALFFFTGPVVTHALAQACLHEGIRPLLAEDRRAATRPRADRPDEGRQS